MEDLISLSIFNVDRWQIIRTLNSEIEYYELQSTLVISTSVISNNRLSRRKNLVLVITQKSKIRLQNIVEKRRNCSWGAISPLFHNIFNIHFYLKESNYIVICKNWLFKLFFSSILQIWYVEVRISRTVYEGPFDFEITRVDCIISSNMASCLHEYCQKQKDFKHKTQQKLICLDHQCPRKSSEHVLLFVNHKEKQHVFATIPVILIWLQCISQGINESANFRFLQRLSVIFVFRRDCPWSLASCQDYRPRKMASCRDSPCDSASCRDSRQEAKSHWQSLQEAIFQAQQSWQEARECGQSQRKPNMTDSLCRKRKLADSFILCVYGCLGWSQFCDSHI